MTRGKCCTQYPPPSPPPLPQSTQEFCCQGCIAASSSQINNKGEDGGLRSVSPVGLLFLSLQSADVPKICHNPTCLCFCTNAFQVLHASQCQASFNVGEKQRAAPQNVFRLTDKLNYNLCRCCHDAKIMSLI